MAKFFELAKGRHYGLDVLRAVAIIAVVLYHWPRTQDQILFRAISHFGFLGVDLFFVLSGYLIAGQTFGLLKAEKFTVKRFYFSRLMRILPNYYFVLLITVLIEGLSRYDWRYLLFLQNFGGLYHFTHSWSLCVEEHFYLLFPLTLMLMVRWNLISKIPLLVATLLGAGILIRFFIWKDVRPDLIYATNVDQGYDLYFTHLFYPTYNRMDGLALGSLLAYVKHFKSEIWSRIIERAHTFLIASIIIFLPLAYLIYHKTEMINSVFGFTAVALCMAGIVISSIPEKSIIHKIKLPGITLVSILSYSIYLTHGHALHLSYRVEKWFGLQNQLILLNSIRVILILLFASVLYWGLEKPILKWRDKVLSKKF